MSKEIIAIDIDDTIAASSEALMIEVNRAFGCQLTSADYAIEADYQGYYEQVWQRHGLTIDLAQLLTDMTVDQSHMKVMPGASAALTHLANRFELQVVTARNRAWYQATMAWVTTNFPNLFAAVNFTTVYEQPLSKGEMCRDIGASCLVDDNPAFCRSAQVAGIDTVLFGNFAWQHHTCPSITRCQDWTAVVSHFQD